jgi:PAS domain S-box-containing protein
MADRAEQPGNSPEQEQAGRREMVLIIEDDPGVARLEEKLLLRAGFAVRSTGGAAEAWEAVHRGGIDLIVLDQNLQGDTSGLEFYERLRASGDQTPAILVTGLRDETTLIRAIRGGLSDFVLKTDDFLDDLTLAVERVISQIRTRRKLAESEERLAGVTLLAEAIPQIVWTASSDGLIDYANRRWLEYSGFTLEQSEGWNWSRALHPDDLERVAQHWSDCVAFGTIFETEYRLRRGSDGAYRWFLVRGELVKDEASQIVKWFGTCTDIDDQKRNEEDLRRANELAESSSRAKDQFLAMLSHELRTPLTPILLMAAAARDSLETPAHLRETFEEIRRNLELECRLIDDLLDVMRIIRGKMPYQFEVVDAHALISRTVDICRVEADAKGIAIVIEFGAADHHVNADAARLQQVLWNLIKNAVKFTPRSGSVEIRSENRGDRFVVDVVDTGIGIEPSHIDTIFNAFEQGEDAITRSFGGLGLGLAISRSIAEGHGGDLTVASAGRNLGSTFTLALPTEVPALPGDAEPGSTPGAELGPESVVRRILFVEDDAMTARVMAKLLRQNGYIVTTANSVSGALEVSPEEYDMVVSDIGLPDGTGLELMRSIRLRHDVPGIALTGYGMEDDIRKSREAGFTAHLTKPLDFAKLDAMIRKVSAGHAVAPEA